MKKLSEIYKELGIDFTFPIKISDANNNETYFENRNGYWRKHERDAEGNWTYSSSHQNRDGYKRGIPKSAKTCEGKVSEEEGRAFCDELFHQELERNKMVRLKNR